jgi:hypothetical protein
VLRPAAARGRWSRREPFQPSHQAGRALAPGTPVAAITRARLRWRRAPRFWRAVPPVAAAAGHADGLLWAIGIGEAPVGLQGTFSLWRDAAALRSFAYGEPAHRAVLARTRQENWYAEDLFARFAIVEAGGTVAGRDPLGGPAKPDRSGSYP